MEASDGQGTQDRVAVIGAGVMGETLLAGMLRGARRPEQVAIAERRAERAEQVRSEYGVWVLEPAQAAGWARTVLLAVKPQDLDATLAEVGEAVGTDSLVISVAAGVTLTHLEKCLKPGTAVVRVMPNTAALVGQGMAAISGGRHATAEHLATTRSLLAATGAVIEVAEDQQDAVTAVSGSGPAYVFYVVEAMVEGGVYLGLSRPVATELAVQTLFGAATMLRESGEHPTVLREQVSSPAGTTVHALRELDAHGVRAAFVSALAAARDRSRELSGD